MCLDKYQPPTHPSSIYFLKIRSDIYLCHEVKSW